MKRRSIAAAVALLLFSLLAVVCAYNIHQLLSGELVFSCHPFTCLMAVLTVPLIRTWWLLLEGAAILAVTWMLFGREYIKYRSKLIYVCPGIVTPEPGGQGQYGTARWMTDNELEKAFTVVKIDASAPELRKLMLCGQDDLKGGQTGREAV